MNLYRLPLLLLLVVAFIGSCKNDDETGSLTLHFIARFEGEPLEMLKTVDLIDTEDIQFSHLSMFVSDIELQKTSGTEFLSDVELVDMSFDNLASATGGYSVQFNDIPAGSYNGIRFGIGVPADVNAQTPSEFPSSNPLSKTGYYWQAWQSYIFMKIEGRVDTLLNGSFNTNFAYHTGTNDLYRVLESNFPLTIEEGQDTELSIVFDYAELIEGIDIPSHPQNHNPQDTVQIQRIVNNLQSAVTLFQ